MANRTRRNRRRNRRKNRRRNRNNNRNRRTRRNRNRRRRGGSLASSTLGILKTALVPYFLYEAQRRMKKRVHSKKRRRR